MAKRNNEQNSLYHCHCREIAEFLTDGGVPMSEGMIKEMSKMLLGNTTEVLGVKIAMPTSSYKMTEHELTAKDHMNGFISMADLITKLVVWASVDLNLELKSPNEQDMVNAK